MARITPILLFVALVLPAFGACGPGNNGTGVVPANCFDKKQNQNEAGVDCGGVCATSCEVASACANGVQDGTETSIDCGGSCGGCEGEACSSPTDCASGACGATGCIGGAPVPSCVDGFQNQGEAGIDCGGPCPNGCMATPTCTDGVQNQGEAGVDCGGPCPTGCMETPTCTDGVQNQGEAGIDCGAPCPNACAAPTCTDGMQNQGEAGIDCGGPCPNGCLATPTCTDGVQNQGEAGIDCGGPCPQGCIATPTATCTDGVRNQGEAGIDCGGPCPQGCVTTPTATCTDGVQNQGEAGIDCGGPCPNGCLAAPTCADGVQNQGEAGIDCGGPCPQGCVTTPTATCTDGVQNQGEAGIDCGGPCPNGCTTTPTATCTDGVQNQGEAGVDCGGPCTACVSAPTCSDGIKNQNESDVDCGGGCPGAEPAVDGGCGGCSPCGISKTCNEHDDCLSSTCLAGVCAEPTCTDGIKNQDEPDVDCGGTDCGPCADGSSCDKHGDCGSGGCNGGICDGCDDGVANANESDVDCGGPWCDDSCSDGQGCNGNSDCTSNSCIDGTCMPMSANGCQVDQDCAPNQFCTLEYNYGGPATANWNGTCNPKTAGAAVGAACTDESDCAGLGCINGYCSAHCLTDSECAGNQTCVGNSSFIDSSGTNESVDVILNQFFCLGFTNPTSSCLAHADCGFGKTCTLMVIPNPNPNFKTDGPYILSGVCEDEPGTLEYGEPCVHWSECKSALCSDQGHCTHYCDSSADCGTVTQDVTTYISLCKRSVRFLPDTAAIESGGESFVYDNSCVAYSGESPACASPNGSEPYGCPSGEFCGTNTIGFGPNVPFTTEFYCFPDDSGLATGQPCNAESECSQGLCMPDGNGDTFCSEYCSPSNDTCGGGTTCQPTTVRPRQGIYESNSQVLDVCLFTD